jgi:hypothetical protein
MTAVFRDGVFASLAQLTPPVAHLSWQESADSSDMLAMAHIRWHRTTVLSHRIWSEGNSLTCDDQIR